MFCVLHSGLRNPLHFIGLLLQLGSRVHFFCRMFVVCIMGPLMLASCANQMSRPALPETPRVEQLTRLALPANAIGLGEGVDDSGSDVITTQASSDLIPTALEDTEPLPQHNVPRLSFANTPLQDVLQAVINDANLALAIVWDSPASKISRSSVTMRHLSGDLTSVLNKLADSYGFYWRFKDSMIHIAADRQYIAQVPPIADLFESLPIMVKTLGGTDVFLDKSARMITFRAGSQSYFKIRNYLDVMRKNRSLIVYDTYIWEVILNDASKMGIDWGALPGAVPATSVTLGSGSVSNASNALTAGLVNAASGGNGLSLSFAGSRFSMNLLIDFLRSQGTINSLSQPKIQLLSGGRATLTDEIATTYVARVGAPSISSGTVIPGSVETSQVKTGVTLEVTGDVSDGTIYSDIALRVSDLISMNSASISGTTITLPKTSSRALQTNVRAKPGDTILLAGIQYDKSGSSLTSGMGIVRSNQSDIVRSELIIVLRPRIKHFTSRDATRNVQALPVATAVASLPDKYFAPKEIEEISVLLPAPAEANTTAPVDINVKNSEDVAPSGIYLQLGAFGNAENAERLRLDVDQKMGLRKEVGQSFRVVTSAQPSEGVLFRVVLGPFADRMAAQKWSGLLRKVGGERPMLLRY